jgi:cytoplasmic tRNA 2-thiolation protein 2
VVLLHILGRQIQRQIAKRGQIAYELHVLMVDTSAPEPSGRASGVFNDLKQNFHSHSFSSKPLSEIFELDSTIFEDLSDLGARKLETPQASLDALLSRTTTASSRTDVLQLLLTRLIVAVAKTNICDAVLWGHSDSRLAAIALSNVAKGRGGYLPFEIADGPTPWGVTFYYPLRDLFKSELVTYANVLPDAFPKLLVFDAVPAAAPPSIRATSIDDLLSNYINAQGEKYPSIMANVVRTAGKLQSTFSPTTQASSMCSICVMPDLTVSRETGDSSICYACLRLKLEMKPMS